MNFQLLLKNYQIQKKYLLTILILFLYLLIPISAQAQAIEDFNPVSHWTCDETSGVRYDSNTTNANDLTDNNTVLSSTGVLNNACDFEKSSSEYLSNTTPSNIPTTNSPRSVSLWFNLESAVPNDDLLALYGHGYANTNNEFTFALLNLSGTQYLDLDYYGGRQYIANSFSLSTWYHAVITFSASTITYYINGTSLGTDTYSSLNTQNDDLFIGRGISSPFYFDGLIDEITVFDYALTSGEVTTLYNSGTPLSYASSSSPPTSTSTATTSLNFEDDNIIFMLGFIVFLLMFIVLGFMFSPFRK